MKKIVIFVLFLFALTLTSCSNVTYNNSNASVYEIKTSVTEIVNNVEGACVGVVATDGKSQSLGSGVIFKHEDDKYYFLTNYHVVSDVIEDANASYKVYVESNTNPFDAYILTDTNKDPIKHKAKDLVVMYFESGNTYKTVSISNDLESHVIKGESVIAIGCPISLDNYNLVSTGVVSLDEYSMSNNGGYVNVIQHTAPINPGNSGGALFNMNGELIGINFKGTTAVKEGESYVAVSGIYYAIAMSSVKEFLNSYDIKTN